MILKTPTRMNLFWFTKFFDVADGRLVDGRTDEWWRDRLIVGVEKKFFDLPPNLAHL